MWRFSKILQSTYPLLLILTIIFWIIQIFFIPLHSQIEILWRIWLQWPPLLFRKCSTLWVLRSWRTVWLLIWWPTRIWFHAGRYDVLIVLEDGSEKEVKFHDRHSRLVYIYTLLHPQGYQRRSLRANNFQALRDLFSRLYFGSAEPLLRAIGDNFDQYFSQAVAQSRRAIRETIGASEQFEIALPQRHGGKTLVSCAANGGHVIIDSSLL